VKKTVSGLESRQRRVERGQTETSLQKNARTTQRRPQSGSMMTSVTSNDFSVKGNMNEIETDISESGKGKGIHGLVRPKRADSLDNRPPWIDDLPHGNETQRHDTTSAGSEEFVSTDSSVFQSVRSQGGPKWTTSKEKEFRQVCEERDTLRKELEDLRSSYQSVVQPENQSGEKSTSRQSIRLLLSQRHQLVQQVSALSQALAEKMSAVDQTEASLCSFLDKLRSDINLKSSDHESSSSVPSIRLVEGILKEVREIQNRPLSEVELLGFDGRPTGQSVRSVCDNQYFEREGILALESVLSQLRGVLLECRRSLEKSGKSCTCGGVGRGLEFCTNNLHRSVYRVDNAVDDLIYASSVRKTSRKSIPIRRQSSRKGREQSKEEMSGFETFMKVVSECQPPIYGDDDEDAAEFWMKTLRGEGIEDDDHSELKQNIQSTSNSLQIQDPGGILNCLGDLLKQLGPNVRSQPEVQTILRRLKRSHTRLMQEVARNDQDQLRSVNTRVQHVHPSIPVKKKQSSRPEWVD